MGAPASSPAWKAMNLSLLRRLFHLSGSVIPITYLFLGRGASLVLASTILVLLACAEALRIGLSLDLPFFRKHLKEKEMKKPTGSLFYVISCLLVILIFDRLTAVAAIFVLAICDPLSSIIGSKWGRRRVLGKSPEGTLTFFVSSVLVLTCFSFGIAAVFVAACTATAAEFLSSRFIDDNLSIPLATAFALSLFK
jgi:diacylglycerol kinase (CTP)